MVHSQNPVLGGPRVGDPAVIAGRRATGGQKYYRSDSQHSMHAGLPFDAFLQYIEPDSAFPIASELGPVKERTPFMNVNRDCPGVRAIGGALMAGASFLMMGCAGGGPGTLTPSASYPTLGKSRP